MFKNPKPKRPEVFTFSSQDIAFSNRYPSKKTHTFVTANLPSYYNKKDFQLPAHIKKLLTASAPVEVEPMESQNITDNNGCTNVPK